MGQHTDKAKGNLKQAAGTLTGNDKLKREGQRDEARGHIKGAISNVKNAAKDVKKPQKHGGR